MDRKVETIGRKRLSIFCPSSSEVGDALKKRRPEIASSSAAHNPAVMAFDSYDCSDNCVGDRAAFFARDSSY